MKKIQGTPLLDPVIKKIKIKKPRKWRYENPNEEEKKIIFTFLNFLDSNQNIRHFFFKELGKIVFD